MVLPGLAGRTADSSQESFMHLPLPLRAVAIAGALVLAASPVRAQEGTWALTNARIETVTRGVIESGTIVIRDGLIEAVGTNVRIPADARVLDLSNRTVYPGLIDLTSTLGLPAAPQQTGGRGAAAQQQGEQAEFTGLDARRMVAAELRVPENDVRSARDQGITTVLVSPGRGAFRGQSALIPLRDGFDTRMVLRSPVAMHMGFEGVRGSYPATLLGVQAQQRQSLHDARRHGLIRDAYDRGARGMARPDNDPDLDALVPVVRGVMPVFWAASAENEIRRAVNIAREFDLRLTVVGATEGFRALDALRHARNTVVTLDFPRSTQVTGWSYRGSLRRSLTDSAATDSAVQRLLEGNAAALHRAGIRFALASGSLNGADFMRNVRKAIAAGLPPDVALQALTIRPAEIAGVGDRLGSIEAGKIANLVVTEHALLSDSARIRMVFVDGERYETSPAARPRARAAAADGQAEERVAQVGGTWALTVSTPQGASPATLTVRQSGSSLEGSMGTEFGTVPVTGGAISGSTMQWSITLDIGGQATTINFRGDVDGNSMSGTGTLGQMGNITFTGTRQP
jgi:imidazolonepropionase-like amidohydrolase